MQEWRRILQLALIWIKRRSHKKKAPEPVDPVVKYCPHTPWPRQRTFLDLDCREAFYGGAAAGGKSEALLMAALQYVHVPGYSALILRRDTQRLRLAGGLIPRSHEWLHATGAKWNGTDRRWTFETGGEPAMISFGYLQDSNDKYRYGSSEFQFIGFDELTEFPEDDYLFLFSRLRRRRDIPVPLRMRSASNPGGAGHHWVKNRFINDNDDASNSGVLWKDDAAYVPARIDDNPAVDADEYRQSLMNLPSVVRERLMNGDWSISETGLIRSDWLRRYTTRGAVVQLLDGHGAIFAEFHERDCRRFITIDPAGTSEDIARERRGRPPCWSVATVWDIAPREVGPMLILRHVWRRRVGFDGLCKGISDLHHQWRPGRMLIEGEKLGRAACDVLGDRLPLECVATGGQDKVTRAAPLIVKLERGEVFLPRYNADWLADLEAEWLAWTGTKEETCDQIDAAAYAAREVQDDYLSAVEIEPFFWRNS